jgi:squalene-hopene/tetraprenyl-beta-curcumene cyclase
MATGKICQLSIVYGILAFVYTVPVSGGEGAPESWDRTKAAQFLDGRGEQWFNFGSSHRGTGTTKSSCVSCHSLLSYALARPVLRQISKEKLPTKFETRVLEQTRFRVANWDKLDTETFQLMYDFDDAKKKQSHGTEAILNALLLAREDRFQGSRKPSDDTTKALAIMWATQVTDGKDKGSWEWINFGMDPWEGETSRYMGACLAAIAVGSAPGYDLAGENGDLKERVGSLRDYLKKQFVRENLHNRVWMLWASASIDGLLKQADKDQLIAQILAKQQASGGWSLGSLGAYARKDVKDYTSTPDGYATGLILHALQLAGLPKENPQISKGLVWLRSNQDPTGAWRAMSVNKNRAPESKDAAKAHIGKFMWDAATAYSVLALSH